MRTIIGTFREACRRVSLASHALAVAGLLCTPALAAAQRSDAAMGVTSGAYAAPLAESSPLPADSARRCGGACGGAVGMVAGAGIAAGVGAAWLWSRPANQRSMADGPAVALLAIFGAVAGGVTGWLVRR